MEKYSIVMINKSLISRLFFGITSTSLSQLIGILQTIITVPFFISAWGVDQYGKWIILTSITMYINLLDFGGQNYIGNILTNNFLRKEYDNFRNNLSKGLSVFIYITIITIVIISILTFLLKKYFLNHNLNITDLYIFLIVGLAFLISIPSGILITVYRACGKYTRATMIGNLLKIISLISTMILLILKISMLNYSIFILISGIIGTLIFIIDIRNSFKFITGISINYQNAKKGFEFLRGSASFWIISLSNIINIQGVILVLSLYVSPATVVLYTTHKMFGNMIGYIGSVFQAPFWPEITNLWTLDHKTKLRRLLLKSISIIMLLSALFIFIIWLFIPYFYTIWSNNKLNINTTILFYIFLQSFLSSGWTTSGWILYATNNTNKIAIFSLLNAMLTILFSFILIPKFQILGLCFATILGDFLFGFIAYPLTVSHILKLKTFKIYKIFFDLILITIPIFLFFFIFKTIYLNLLIVLIWIFVVIKFSNIFKNLRFLKY